MASKYGPINRLSAGLAVDENQQGGPCTTAATVGFADPQILSKYANYADLFNKKTAYMLLEHQE